MHPHAPVRSAELPPLFQRGGEAMRWATLGRVGEAVHDPSGGGRGCSSPCATQEVGSLWWQRVKVSGQHATPADWGREKERGSATAVGGKGQGNSARPQWQRVRRPFPFAPNPSSHLCLHICACHLYLCTGHGSCTHMSCECGGGSWANRRG